jgi:AcrR family transcriptional regulator
MNAIPIDDIAERVGMTARTIYHHFDDHDAIAEALTEHQRQQLAHLTKLESSGTLAERVDALVDQRAARPPHERGHLGAAAARAAPLGPTQPQARRETDNPYS